MKSDELIQYTDARQGEEWQRLHPKCKQVVTFASFVANFLFGEKFLVCTRIFDKKTKDSGIHELYRAFDAKPLQNMVFTYKLIEIVNNAFVYDPERPEFQVVHPNPYHGTAPHLHFQSHDRTCIVSPEKQQLFLAQINTDHMNFKPMVLS